MPRAPPILPYIYDIEPTKEREAGVEQMDEAAEPTTKGERRHAKLGAQLSNNNQ